MSAVSAVSAVAVLLAGCGAAPEPTRPGQAPRCPAGVVQLRATEEAEALAGCARLAGLVVRTGASVELTALRELAELDGDLVIGPSLSISSLGLPKLLRVGGAVRITGNTALGGVFLPALRAAGRVEIEDNAALASVSLPALVETARLVVRGNAELEALTVSGLERVGALALEGSPRLGLLQADRLQRVETWEVDLPAVDAGELAALQARVTPPGAAPD